MEDFFAKWDEPRRNEYRLTDALAGAAFLAVDMAMPRRAAPGRIVLGHGEPWDAPNPPNAKRAKVKAARKAKHRSRKR